LSVKLRHFSRRDRCFDGRGAMPTFAGASGALGILLIALGPAM